MFYSIGELLRITLSDRERIQKKLLQDKEAFNALISIGSLISNVEIAKMYRRLNSQIAQSTQLLATMRKVKTLN